MLAASLPANRFIPYPLRFCTIFAQALLLIQPVAVRFGHQATGFGRPAAHIDEIAITIRELQGQQPVNSWGTRAIQPYQGVGGNDPQRRCGSDGPDPDQGVLSGREPLLLISLQE